MTNLVIDLLVVLVGLGMGLFIGSVWERRRARRELPEILREALELDRLHHRNRLLDNGRLFDARPDNGPPSRMGKIRYTGERPTPGDKPPTRM